MIYVKLNTVPAPQAHPRNSTGLAVVFSDAGKREKLLGFVNRERLKERGIGEEDLIATVVKAIDSVHAAFVEGSRGTPNKGDAYWVTSRSEGDAPTYHEIVPVGESGRLESALDNARQKVAQAVVCGLN